MVALHNHRLTDRDLFPGVLWTDKEWHAKREELEAQAREEGHSGASLIFRVGRLMEAYQQSQPSLKDRQAIRKRLFPRQPVERGWDGLTDEEKEYIVFKLTGANDPLAESVVRKLAKTT